MKKISVSILMLALVFAVFSLTSCGTSSNGDSGDAETKWTFDPKAYSLSERVEYQGVSMLVDPSWKADLKEGICTWFVDGDHDVKLILTTYKTAGTYFYDLGESHRFIHLKNRKDSKHHYSSHNFWIPYEDRSWFRFDDYDAEGEDENGVEVTDCFIAGQNHNYISGSKEGVEDASFILELIGPSECLDKFKGSMFVKSIADTIEWDDSKTMLDSYELGFSNLSED